MYRTLQTKTGGTMTGNNSQNETRVGLALATAVTRNNTNE